jgi:cytochrome c oxidase assembly protein subunit 15
MNNKYNPGLFWFAAFTAFATFLLIGLGGLVTSHEAGMSVPDWPTSYGYNMFALPIKFWKGGALYEHSHRVFATFIGGLTTVLAIWIWLKDSRKWMQWLGVAAFLLVIVQGVLGGLRVRLDMDWIGVPHGAIAQSFLVLLCAIALFSSRWWGNSAVKKPLAVPRGLRSHVLYVAILIFVQLLIGATMRHQHAGLAIPDFPLAYGKLWPSTTPAAVESYNAHRIEVNGENPITAFQVVLQMIHRIVALLIFLGVAAAAFLARKKLIVGQIALGAATILTNKAADIATLHVMVGALALVLGALWWLAAERRTRLAAA